MKEIFSAFGSEVFRPIVTLVLPGTIATSTGIVAALWGIPDFRSFADSNRVEIVGAGMVLAIFFGLVCEDLGSRLETHWDRKAGEQHEGNWYSYLRQAFRIEPVGHHYMRNLVLRFKFELGCWAGCLLSILGVWWWPTTYGARLLATAPAVAVALYFLWEAHASHRTLARLREEMLKGINIVPPEERGMAVAAR